MEVLEKVVSRDGFGAEVVGWATAATVWGSVEPLRGREYIEGKQGQVEVSHRVVIRGWADRSLLVDANMRLRLEGGRVLEVVSAINPLERGERWELMCREMVD